MMNDYKENYSIRKAVSDTVSLRTVEEITRDTIQEIYPHYYPKGAVEFFLSHHHADHILQDLEDGIVYLLFAGEQQAVGTITLRNNEICRLFVLPEYQHKGYGRALMQFAEQKIYEQHRSCILDASLPAKAIYLKRGYEIVKSCEIQTESGDVLCYDVMQKLA